MSALLADLEAERTCLGAVLVDNATLPVLEGIVRAEHFSRPAHRAVYAAMLAMGEAGRAIDLLTLRDELGDQAEAVGGPAYLAGLVDGLPRITNPAAWARIVVDKARRRAALELGQKLAEQARTGASTTLDLLEQFHGALSRLMESGERGIRGLDDVMPMAWEGLGEFMEHKSGVTGVPTGLPDVDGLTGGMGKGALWIVAARPGRGKSAFCSQVAVHAAKQGFRVLVFAMEMPPESVAKRMLLAEAGVDKWELRQREQKADAWSRLMEADKRLKQLPLYFHGGEAPTLAQVRAAARQQQQTHGLDLVVVDYLQRCSLDSRLDRWVAVGDLAKGLKSLARSLNVPVLAACQTNADTEERRPTMADLAQARQVISAEADLVAFLHPEAPAEWREHATPQMNLLVDKQRDGAMMSIPLRFEKACTRFACMARDTSWNGSL